MIDFAELWIVLRLLEPGEASRLLEEELAPKLKQRTEAACSLARSQKADGLELDWGEVTGAAALARLGSATEGKQFYIAWLKDRYGYNIARLNAAYGLEFTSFSDLAESDFSKVDRSRKAVREDDKEFLVTLEQTMEQKLSDWLQACGSARKTAWKRSRT